LKWWNDDWKCLNLTCKYNFQSNLKAFLEHGTEWRYLQFSNNPQLHIDYPNEHITCLKQVWELSKHTIIIHIVYAEKSNNALRPGADKAILYWCIIATFQNTQIVPSEICVLFHLWWKVTKVMFFRECRVTFKQLEVTTVVPGVSYGPVIAAYSQVLRPSPQGPDVHLGLCVNQRP